ncbi:MAG: hypothetical protein QM831_02315 [Kofleriaceae bacterium]
MKALLLALAACGATPKASTMQRQWQVFDGSTLILDVSSQPGEIHSVAELPPDTKPMQSGFMSATSHDATHEGQLNGFLRESHSVDEFLSKVQTAGLTVKPL